MNVPAIRVTNLSFQYTDHTPALYEVSFEVQPGERIALIGPNGAGKSTLLCHLNGILGMGSRECAIEIDGVPVLASRLAEIRQRVGLVFQDPDDQLFCATIFDDVAFGPLNMRLPADEVKRRVREALHCVGLEGYETRSAYHLSGGEKKRVSLATVVSMDVDILAFDEPSSNLDPKSRRALIHWLQRCGKTLLIATHDLDMAYESTDRVLVLNQGRLIRDGATREVLQDREFLEAAGLELPLRFHSA
ncbi:MAG: ABC transporter ATP-binding protein [bacterium]|jgi:cobalt/nickel transport system ATP-binding protein|nr:ABC transporter ATP-binding protein [bacterium]